MTTKSQEDIDKQLLEQICQLYDITTVDLNFIIAIDHNFVYEFTKNDREYILRGGTRHSPVQVKAELEWILYLNSKGVKVSLPILSKNKKYHEVVDYKGEDINSVVFERAPGKEIEFRNPEEWNESIWEEMGRTLGKMHTAAVEYNQGNPVFKRKTAFESIHASSENILDPIKDNEIIKKFNGLKNKLNQLPRENDAFGLIQYDFHSSNFNIHDSEIIVFDFDDSYFFFFIYDLAACIHETVWAISDERKLWLANKFIPSLWKGYCEEFKLDRKWLDYLLYFLKWREFIIYITVIETLNDDTTPDRFIPEYKEYAAEFKARTESDEQIVPIPEDLTEWFKEY